MSAPMDFFYFFGSTYTYLTVMRIEDAAANAGVEVRWRPFNVREIMNEMNNIPFADKPVKAAYMWRDLARRAAKQGTAFAAPPAYPVDPDLLANRVGIVAAQEGWCPAYTKASYRAWFLEGKPLGVGENVAAVLREIRQDAVLARAGSAATNDALAAETARARELGIFGSPTFAVDGEIFWGDDRLEDALAWHARRWL